MDTLKTRLGATMLLIAFLIGCSSSKVQTGTDASPGITLQSTEPVFVDGLGKIAFANSGSPDAQDAFYRGVLLLHSFEFDPATEAFREAQSIDPDFAMAYWGEAMANNYPLWRQINMEEGREALNRLAPSAAERQEQADTDRERMYLQAVEELYGQGSKADRDTAYMHAMQRLHKAYPDDDEARTFYALSILGSLNGERDFEVYGKAAETAQPVFERNPLHPGAAHYIIHSYDDPEHAQLGLAAADAYDDIAPNAAHAQHMTTHIFVALGMWDRVVENNISAMKTQNKLREGEGRRPSYCGHYSSWRHYGHLQLGEFEEAEALMDDCYGRVQDDPNRGEWSYFASMRSLHIVDTEDWSLANRWAADVPTFDYSNAAPGTAQSRSTYLFGNAFAALRSGAVDKAQSILADIPADLGGDRILRMELEALLAIEAGDVEDGLVKLDGAAELEASYPMMFGPPEIAKPTFELLAEELLRAGKIEEAAAASKQALERTPGRRVAVEGAEAIAAR